MQLFKNIFDRKKDWQLNRSKRELVEFVAFHHFETSLNILFDKIAFYLGNDFSSFDDFGPYGLTKTSLKQGFDIEKHILEIRKNHPTFGVSFIDNNQAGEVRGGSVCRFDVPQDYRAFVSIQFFKNTAHASFLTLIYPNTFYFAYFAEIDYINWQGQYGLSWYKYRGGLNYSKNKHGEKSVDISERPGRMVFTKYFNYCGASEMWFGPLIYSYIPQELILAFEGAIEIKVLEHNITYVHLYEGVYDGDEPGNQEIQKRFREHIRIDEIKVE